MLKLISFKRKCNHFLKKNANNRYTINSEEKRELALKRYNAPFL
jgi:hypothetical protein